MSRQATVIVSDEMTSSLTGKLHILGAYTGDIVIAADPTFVGQLVFLFIMESDPDDPFKKVELRVELPGGSTAGIQVPVQMFMPSPSDQIRWTLRYPLLFQNAALRPGPITAKVIHDKGEILAAAPFIILRAPLPPQPMH